MSVTAAVGTACRASGAPHTGRSAASRRPGSTSASRRAAVRGLLRAYHRHGDLGARARLIQQYLPLVRRLARRYVGHGEQLEDLVQVGSIGLIKAVDRFQLDRDVDLASYAIPTIDGEIKRHLRDRAWPIRIPRRLQELDPTLRARVTELVDGQNGEFERESSVERGYELGEDRIALAGGFHVLDERERLLLRLAYFEGLSQAQIAPRVGISQIHVSRLTRRALGKLRAEIGQTEP
jgi:RNA polymerase sigma-B factor